MKGWIPLLALLFLLFPAAAPRVTAEADTLRYAVAADSNVWFYTAESENDKLFLLPQSYYVRVLHEGDPYSAVEYLVNDPPYRKIMGYCRTDAIETVDFIPARPFLRREITVRYALPLPNPFDDTFGDIERTFVYYGSRYENGNLYYYVLSEGSFGFIPAEEELVYEHNDDYLNVPSEPASGEETETPSESGKGGNVLQIVLICLACVAAVAVAVFVLKGKRRSAPDSDRDP